MTANDQVAASYSSVLFARHVCITLVFTRCGTLLQAKRRMRCLQQGGRQGALSYGLQTSPQHRLDDLTGTAGVQRLAEACQEHMSYCVAYSPLATSTPPGDLCCRADCYPGSGADQSW
jgi:hypothetical protein